LRNFLDHLLARRKLKGYEVKVGVKVLIKEGKNLLGTSRDDLKKEQTSLTSEFIARLANQHNKTQNLFGATTSHKFVVIAHQAINITDSELNSKFIYASTSSLPDWYQFATRKEPNLCQLFEKFPHMIFMLSHSTEKKVAIEPTTATTNNSKSIISSLKSSFIFISPLALSLSLTLVSISLLAQL